MSVANLVFTSQSSADISDLRNPALWLVNAMGGRATASGQTVTPETAMTLSTVYSCLRNLADDIGTMPIKVYDQSADGSKEEVRDHPVYQLVHDTPNPEMNAADFWGTMEHWAAGWGNAIAEIEMDVRGEPMWLWPFHPSRVALNRDKETGALFYEVRADDGRPVQLPQDRVFHLKGFGQGLWGYSAIQFGADSIGLGLALQEFGSSFFANGINSNGVIEVPEELDPDKMGNLRRELAEAYGGAENAFKPLLMYGGMKWTSISIPPEQAQFLESRTFSVEDVARWFRMPLPLIGHLEEAHYNNVEALDLDYAKHTLGAWTVRINQEIKRKLLGDGTLIAEHVMEALLRGDLQGRADYYTKMVRIGGISRNQIAAKENFNPVPGGDVYYIEHNLKPIGPDGLPVEGAEPEPDEPEPEPEDDAGEVPDEEPPPFGGAPQRENAQRAVGPIFLDAFERIVRMESDRLNKHAASGDDYRRQFYGSHARFVASSLSAAAKTLAVLVWPAPSTESVAEAAAVERVEMYAVDWCEAAYNTLTTGDLAETLEQWSKTRAAAGASELVELVTAAVMECET